MQDLIAEAAERAAWHGAPPKTFQSGPGVVVRLADGPGHLLVGATLTAWVGRFDEAAVATDRSE